MREAEDVAPGWCLQRFGDVASTMDIARDLAGQGAADRTLVRADSQSGGRGRYGRSWRSEAGNLYMTALLREDRPMGACAVLSFAAALALSDAVGGPDVTLKWPNDVLIAGRKTAGILLEAGCDATGAVWVIIGMGVNVSHHPEGTTLPATHLAAEGRARSLGTLCRAVTEALDHWRGIWHRQGASALTAAWRARAHGLGQPITVRLADREIAGRFETLDDHGRLIVTAEDGRRIAIAAGDVYFG